jgi:hypothetical protein
MKALKNLGMALLGCMALVTFNASAQTQNVPVSCSWVQTGSQAGQSAAIITFQCKESNGNVAATRSLTYTAPSWQVTNCSISLASGVFNSGTCQSASLYRVEPVVTPQSSCANAGKYLMNVCANSLSGASPAWIQQQCGSGCGLRTEIIGWTNQCPIPSGGAPAGSPEVKVFCK